MSNIVIDGFGYLQKLITEGFGGEWIATLLRRHKQYLRIEPDTAILYIEAPKRFKESRVFYITRPVNHKAQKSIAININKAFSSLHSLNVTIAKQLQCSTSLAITIPRLSIVDSTFSLTTHKSFRITKLLTIQSGRTVKDYDYFDIVAPTRMSTDSIYGLYMGKRYMSTAELRLCVQKQLVDKGKLDIKARKDSTNILFALGLLDI
jgi:hypothetical protein